jgi:NAD(P)-dependent dehydrogenase (short-subunit alcohol dehydrogenase family)
MKKSVAIIGGTKGLGLEITRNFLESGYRVACGSRMIDNVDLPKSNDLKLISVDARSRKSIRNFFE